MMNESVQIYKDILIQEIIVQKFPLVIITDGHKDLKNVEKVRALYPSSNLICLGDITDLFKKDVLNSVSIQYFIDNKIPYLIGNHEQFIIASFPNYETWGLSYEQFKHLIDSPIGFKLLLPDNSNYFCFHNRPNDLWSLTEEKSLTKEQFIETYSIDEKTVGVIQGHNHKAFVASFPDFKVKRFSIGALLYKQYALLTERGIEFKRL